jgi:hypothetical protein
VLPGPEQGPCTPPYLSRLTLLDFTTHLNLIHERFEKFTITTPPTMDILSCATLSLGAVYWSRSFYNCLADSFSTAFLTVFTLQYLAIKAYRIFIVPHFLSVLRKIPGPNVSYFYHLLQSITDSFRMDISLSARPINFFKHCQLSDSSRGCANSQMSR